MFSVCLHRDNYMIYLHFPKLPNSYYWVCEQCLCLSSPWNDRLSFHKPQLRCLSLREVSLFCAPSALGLHYPLSVACLFSTSYCELFESRSLILIISVLKVYSFFLHRLHTLFPGKRCSSFLSASKITNYTAPSAHFFNYGSSRSFAVCWPRCNSPLPLIQRQLVGGYHFLL